MAQVIKYDNGGSTTKKYGTFTYDNITHQVDDDFINQLSSYGKSLESRVGNQFQNIIDAVKHGKDVTFTSSGDGSLSDNVSFDVTDSQQERLKTPRRALGRFFGNAWKGKETSSRNAISALKNFTYVKPTPGSTTHDWSKNINVEYKKDKDGKYELVDGKRVLIGGANSLQGFRRLGDLEGITNYTSNDTFKGYGKLDKQAYIDLYNKLGTEGINDLKQRIEDGSWTEKDRLALDDIGIFLGEEPSEKDIVTAQAVSIDPETVRIKEEKDRFNKAGLDYNLKNIFNVDKEGKVSIINPSLQSIIGNGNVWLNDEFKNIYGSDANFVPETTGLFIINGRVYRGDNQEALSKLPEYLKFVSENKDTGGNASSIKQYWKDNNFSGWSNLGHDDRGNPIYSPVFKDSEYGRDVSGQYIREADDPLIYDYYKDYNTKNNNLFDIFGHPLVNKATRIYIDPITKKAIKVDDPRYKNFITNLREQPDKKVIEDYYTNATTGAFSPYYTLGAVGNVVKIADYGNAETPNTGYSLYQKPGSDLYYWYDENPGGDNYILNSSLSEDSDKMRDYLWNVDPKLGDYLSRNQDVLRDPIVKNAISGLIRNPYLSNISLRRVNPTDYEQITRKYPVLSKILSDIYTKGATIGYGDYRKLYSGTVDNPELREITSPEDLESRGLAYRLSSLGQIPYKKQGGVLKLQIGGTSISRAHAIKASNDNVKKVDTKLRKSGEDKIIGDGTEMTGTDKAELIALIADAASLGATFVPVYGNAVGAGVGAVGSMTGFGADVSRDGLDWGDVGSLALNLGLDAATLLPGLGTGAKATKLAKALKSSKAVASIVKNSSKILSGAAAVNGLSTAWQNLQDGEWTIKDIRTIINGVRGATNLGKTAGNAQSKSATGDIVTLRPKTGELPSIKLRRSELDNIHKLPSNIRTEKLEELLISKLPKETKTDQIADIISEYGIKQSGNLDWSWREPFNIKRGNTVSTKQFNFDKVPGEFRDPNKLSLWNRHRIPSIRDAKTNRNNPYFKDFSITRTQEVNGIPTIGYWRSPITNSIYSNFAPNFGVFGTIPDERRFYDMENKPTFYKNGGKVVKAKDGWQLQNNQDGMWDPVGTQFRKKFINTDNKPRIEKNTNYYSSRHNTNSNILKNNDIIPSTVQSKSSSSGSSKGQEDTLSFLDKLKNINPDIFLGVGDFITSAMGINKSSQKMKDSFKKKMIGSQKQMPIEFYSTYRDNGLFRMYGDRINNIRQFKTATNDPNQVTSERLMRDQQVDQLANERDTKLSQMVGDFNDKLLAQKQQYSNMRTQVANDNKNNWYRGLAEIDMVDANKTAQHTQSIKNLIHQFRHDAALDTEEAEVAQNASAQLKAQNSYEAALNDKYRSLYTPEMQTKHGTFETFLANHDPRGVANIRNMYQTDSVIDQYNAGRSHLWWGRPDIKRYEMPYRYVTQPGIDQIIGHKSGGRIQRFRNVGKQTYLDQQKAINKAVNDLNNNIIKIFLKMMS